MNDLRRTPDSRETTRTRSSTSWKKLKQTEFSGMGKSPFPSLSGFSWTKKHRPIVYLLKNHFSEKSDFAIPYIPNWTSSTDGIESEDYLEGPAQHVPADTTETVEWCAPAVLRLAWYETFSHRVDPSEPARFFIVSSFSMLRANFCCEQIFWANSCSEQIWFSWAVFLYCEQIFFALSNLCLDRICVMRTYLDCT